MTRFPYAILIIVLTYSFSIVYYPFVSIYEQLPWLKATRWALIIWSILVVIGYRVYARQSVFQIMFKVPEQSSWRIAGIVLICAYLVVAPLAVIFPSPHHDWKDMITIVVLPFAEELIFRGVLWDLVVSKFNGEKRFFGISRVLLVTSLLFGLMHWQYVGFQFSQMALFTIIFTGTMGFVFGKVRESSDTISLAIIAHLVFNSVWNLFLRIQIISF